MIHADSDNPEGEAPRGDPGAEGVDAAESSDGFAADPALFRLVEGCTARIQAGESIDYEQLAGQYPEYADQIRTLLPTLLGLAELRGVVEEDATLGTADPDDPGGGRVFGDFRIVRELGRGGMGVVYEAREVPLDRRVALKVLSAAAALDPRSLQRFQLEAQVAGWLQHPRIVPVHSVGAVGDVPYYAMQYVEGGSLSDLIAEMRGLVGQAGGRSAGVSGFLAAGLLSGRFVSRGRESGGIPSRPSAIPIGPAEEGEAAAPPGLSIRSPAYVRTVARLGIQAAEALGFAHDQGIVHRDIKPANLLLDRNGDLWLADFGMADVQGDAGLTATGDLPGTLRYMSPEQATGRRALVDRRTDIYSLGATLYELLTLRPVVDGADSPEVIRRIAEEEPAPPRRHNPAIPADLATVVGKAIAKAPAARYETSWLLADDLRRFLDGLPISARPVGPLPRAWRRCRRKPLQSALAAGLVLALVAGFAGITWSWREAVRQKGLLLVARRQAIEERDQKEAQRALAESAERSAKQQAARADAINQFLVRRLLGQGSPENNPEANRLTLLEVLDRAASEVGTSFESQPEIEASVRLAIGQTYHGLGEHAKSEAHLRGTLEAIERAPDASPRVRLEAEAELGHILNHLGRFDDSKTMLDRSVEETRRVLGPSDPVALRAAEYLGDLAMDRGRYAEAESLCRRCLDDAGRVPSPDRDFILNVKNNLGMALMRRGKAAEAESLYRQVVRDSRASRGTKHPGTVSAINNLAILLEEKGEFAEAEQLFRECLALNREVLSPRHPGNFATAFNLAHVLDRLGRPREAEALLRQNIETMRGMLGPEHPATLYSVSRLGTLLRDRGELDEAERLLRPCLETQKRVLGADHPDARKTVQRLDSVLGRRSAAKKDAPLAGPGR